MNKPSQQVKDIFYNWDMNTELDGYNLNWCEKTGCWCVFTYDFDRGNTKIASIIVDKERVYG